jgi:hypothetical protein
MPIIDQVATAPCTDSVQVRRPTLEAKPVRGFSERSLADQSLVEET